MRRFERERLRWMMSEVLAKTGRRALYTCCIPLVLALWWGVGVGPENNRLQQEMSRMRKQLEIPLPVVATGGKKGLNQTQYQQLKVLFDILRKHQLQVAEGNYRFLTHSTDAQAALRLNIPLSGQWLPIAQALNELGSALPVVVDSVTLRRDKPESTRIMAQLELSLRMENQP